MAKAGVRVGLAPSTGYALPTCQWSFNQARHFEYLAGDSVEIFHRPPSELLYQHFSVIEDQSRSWATRLDRIFSGSTAFEQLAAPASGVGHTVTHVAIRAPDSDVLHAAGFAYPAGQAVPPPKELAFAALSVLQMLRAERARTIRFVHDVVAQCLTSTGLQLELLRLEVEQQADLDLLARTREIQDSIESALQRVRTFSSEEDVPDLEGA